MEDTYNYNNNSTNVEMANENDIWTCYLTRVVSVMVNDKNTPIRGRLIKIDANYLYVERLSGTITTILRTTVTRITTARDRKAVV